MAKFYNRVKEYAYHNPYSNLAAAILKSGEKERDTLL